MNKSGDKRLFNSKWHYFILTFFGILLFIVSWFILSYLVNNPLFPNPYDVFKIFFESLGSIKIYEAIVFTLLRLLVSFAISFAVAFILGIISGLNKTFRTILSPTITILKTIPTAALILILIVLFRPTYSLTIITFLVMFPILYEAICNGIINVDENIKKALRVDVGLHNPRSIFKVLIPCASPYILLGIIQTIGLGMKVSLMSEILVGNNKIPGLGILIKLAYQNAYMDQVFAYSMFGIILIGIIDISLKIVKQKIN